MTWESGKQGASGGAIRPGEIPRGGWVGVRPDLALALSAGLLLSLTQAPLALAAQEGCCTTQDTQTCKVVTAWQGSTAFPAPESEEIAWPVGVNPTPVYVFGGLSQKNRSQGNNAGWTDQNSQDSDGVWKIPAHPYSDAKTKDNIRAHIESRRADKTQMEPSVAAQYEEGLNQIRDNLDQSINPTSIAAYGIGLQGFPASECRGAVLVAKGVIGEIESLRTQMLALSSTLRAAQASGAADLLPYPDPKLTFKNASLLKRYNGKVVTDQVAQSAAGSGDTKKLRFLLAENFERMARIFIAGTDQLKRDFPDTSPDQFTKTIYGLYHGHRPDLLNSTDDKPLYLGKDPHWNLCNLGGGISPGNQSFGGVANPSNRWFKNASGDFREEIRRTANGSTVINHICTANQGTSQLHTKFTRAVVTRGMVINSYMTLMETIRDSIKAGSILSVKGLGSAVDTCAAHRAKIEPMREKVREILDGMKKAQNKGKDSALLECGESARIDQNAKIAKVENDAVRITKGKDNKLGMAATGAVCDLAQAQIMTELNMVAQYAYCVWHVTGQAREKQIFDTALQTAGSKPAPMDNFLETLLNPKDRLLYSSKASPTFEERLKNREVSCSG